MKKSFIIYTEWATLINGLPEMQAGKLIKAICAYQTGAEYTSDDQTVNAIFNMLKTQMDEDAAKYAAVCKKRADAVKTRWEKKKPEKAEPKKQAEKVEAEKVETARTDTTDYKAIVEDYNSTCKSFPQVTKLSDARKKAIKARLNNYSAEDIHKAFVKAEASDFLKGANNRNWTANIDWMLKDNNLAKILDGNYDNHAQKTVPIKTAAKRFTDFEQRQTDYDALMSGGRRIVEKRNIG